jgi:hypothetical protein
MLLVILQFLVAIMPLITYSKRGKYSFYYLKTADNRLKIPFYHEVKEQR